MSKMYLVWVACPHCKTPCGPDVGNEYVPAKNKAEARELINAYKPCRHMQIIKIEEVKK